MKKLLLFFVCLSLAFTSLAQMSVVKGHIFNSINNESLPYAVVLLKDAQNTYDTTSDSLGNFEFKVPKAGLYNLDVKMSGFKSNTIYDINVRPDRSTIVNVPLEEDIKNLGEVKVEAAAFEKKEESPVSLRTIGVAEIKRNPGGNRDISKVIQSLPGVASVPTFRNDLIVRGGSPNENRFFIDGIEVPNINHFATQGASGGPVGMLNVDFIQDVNFYSGAFPANRGNAMSSVLDFKYKDGRDDKPAYALSLGASDLSATFDGPLSSKSTLIASYRRSYLQFLFSALGLPFLPTYNDFQFKYKYKPDNKNEFTFIGLGAYDVVTLNKEANETEEQQYILGTIPENNQWNYTVGGTYKHYYKNSYLTVVLSRNHLNNQALKYQNNDESDESKKILDYNSEEIENKFRIEETSRRGSWKFNYGIGIEDATYTNTTFNKVPYIGTVNYNAKINLQKYAGFAQVSKTFSRIATVISLGARVDGNNYSSSQSNPADQFSPRLSLTKNLGEHFSINASAGIFYQMPTYTILGYKNNDGNFVNKEVKYIRNQQAVAGLEYVTDNNARITLEGYYKLYDHYPFNLVDSISIANEGSDFGVVGDVPVDSRSKGRSYGIELLIQQKLYKDFYALLAYTYGKSEFTNLGNDYTASSSDFRHTMSLTAGKVFKKNWEAGIKFRMSSGAPYTPNDVEATALKSNWDITGQAVRDYSQLNSARTNVFHQLDIRVDKKYYFKKSSLDLYVDIQNLYNQKTVFNPNITVVRDQSGNAVTDPNDASKYLVKELENSSGTVVPTIGFIFEF
ncbi:MAG TPA: carboxypeptidase-like regulatory domain-containing protein [Bacteroidia bacterium]|nr:carboxypeptidase-like regulatory domain-containing protein [Bacteroidia bacterium]